MVVFFAKFMLFRVTLREARVYGPALYKWGRVQMVKRVVSLIILISFVDSTYILVV